MQLWSIILKVLQIIDDENRRLMPGESGEICIRPKKYTILVNHECIHNDNAHILIYFTIGVLK